MEGIENAQRQEGVGKQEAFKSVAEGLVERMQGIENQISDTYVFENQTYPITSKEDLLVAYVQILERNAANFHSEIIEEGTYNRELVSAKVQELVEAYVQTLRRYAELRSIDEESAEELEAMLPGIKALTERTNALWHERYENRKPN